MEDFRNNGFDPEENAGNSETPVNNAPDIEKPAEEFAPIGNIPHEENVPPFVPPYVPPYNYENAPGREEPTAGPENNNMPPRPPMDHSYGGPVRPDPMGRPTPPPPPRPPMGGGYTPPQNNGYAPGGADQNQGPAAPRSGEYRYVPPYAGIGNNTPGRGPSGPMNNGPRPEPQPRPQPKEKKKEKKEKTVRTFSTTALIFILIGAVVLSFASGMLGALFIEGGLDFEKIASEEKEEMNAPEKENKPEKEEDSDLVVDKAENKEDDGDSTSDKLVGSYDITDVCAVVSASVVEITTEFNQTYYGYYQYVKEGAGSGVIISTDGYIITNAHVITNPENGKLADAIKIRLNSGEDYDAKIIGSDSDSDIALLKINAKKLTAATIGNSDAIEVGEQVIAVGNPLGELGGTVTSGIVSATNREITVENNKMTLIQIDAAINPGNSGGGLFNTKGELIGIVNAKTTDVTVEGLGFAIPVNEAISVVEELESHGYVTGKTHIGISLTDVSDAFTAYYYFRSESTGVYIANVQEGYNDDVLEYGDRITAIDDNEITSSADVKEIIQECEVGDKLTFTVSREGKIIDVEVTCYEYVPEDDVSFNEE